MATYTKKLKTITVHTFLTDMASSLPISDTPTDAAASRVIADFVAGRDLVAKMTMDSQSIVVKIPYSAVSRIDVESTDTEVTKDDPYCEE